MNTPRDKNSRANAEGTANATARANRLWAKLIVEELVRNGVEFFFVAPGSRSTPLVAAIAENPKAEAVVHFDERGTSFAALGCARATGHPAAWVTTSGTAVANGLPAVVEASVDDVPMLLLTADRPPELRKTGANQTINQPGIFGEHVRWSFDVPAPDLNVDAASVLTTVDQSVHRALRPPSGPVHMNMMFREPFLPDDENGEPELPPHLEHWRAGDSPYTKYSPTKPTVDEAEIEAIRSELRGVERGIVVAGRLRARESGEAAARLAESLGWPFLPDIGSQARIGGVSGTAIANYDILLADEAFASNAPEAVLHIGGGAVSKRLSGYIARHRPKAHTVVKESPARLDPNHLATRSVESNVTAFCDSLSKLATDDGREGARAETWREASEDDRHIEEAANAAAKDGLESPWASMWRDASEKAARRIEEAASKAEEISEPFVARSVSRLIPDGHGLVVASSMPIRDMDAYAVSDRTFVPVAANRGASGIDGTVATAAGYARGSGRPATLVVGDLALLHDLNSLAMLRSLPVTVVAVNNNGGGIFSFLPVSRQEAFFEEYFGTPQSIGFENAAAMFGLGYENPKDMRGFEEAYRRAVSGETAEIIEVRTDRGENVAFHRGLLSGG
ncbi:MAG: 2-succinyl-5-enolpyruvyl-6-hydroxy-3-cyclohexene-1-carboxylic-acid synthase [Rubrobacter sp.]|nr:2-succinyl-5-enolpyruvyl-6-hydroxy-3-cyclohexene-1-carboxylic-acid synthase [Rubrobacter sp.]